MDAILIVVFGFVVFLTLNSYLNPFRPRKPEPALSWLDEVEFVSPYPGSTWRENKSDSSEGKSTQMECVVDG